MGLNFYNVIRYGLFVLILALTTSTVFSQPACHDPSRIIKSGSKYYLFCTGNGITMYSSTTPSFSTWTQETSPFASGNPSWIASYVSGFGGNYWAPEIFYMNNQYYLYYSVSMGAKPCAIGLVTTPSLSSPTWTDQGMVVYSDNTTAYGSIDPCVFADNSGNLWMAYGSHLNGIVLAQLSTSTGKALNSTRYNIVKPSQNDAEGAAIIYNGGYYYVFYQRLTCCAGYNSSYTMYVGRSTSVTGPYYDKNGVSLTSGSGGSIFLDTDGRYIGPGHFGYGESTLTYHFYDAYDNGAPKLAVNTLSFSNGWPVAGTLSSGGSAITAGMYTITNRNSGMVLDVTNCGTTDGTLVDQWTNLSNYCQKWNIAYAGNGFYTIQNVNSSKMLDVVNGGFASGTSVDQWTSNGLKPQQWAFVKTGSYYRIVSRCNGKDLEIANASSSNGGSVDTYADNGCYCQHWTFSSTKSLTIDKPEKEEGINLYPSPASTEINITGIAPNSQYRIYSINGSLSQQGELASKINIGLLSNGLYFIEINSDNQIIRLKFIKE